MISELLTEVANYGTASVKRVYGDVNGGSFRNFANLKAICYWMAGDLDLRIPSAFTHP